ncbi:hypothetical protein PTTG_29310 [Puccinia triticina 1-1 BBBD Race 1]|uniref:Uncharacterized protein n=1 Tax=Puccinia triticina (isolate 1-1 / race 1 (BBBD)) TaxID=630390 RepID=A0A180G4Y3_PUCT1|nr:hypothetical protein PTTG_29310 [Puccinia triticina 1-1 BBBD Race 1]
MPPVAAKKFSTAQDSAEDKNYNNKRVANPQNGNWISSDTWSPIATTKAPKVRRRKVTAAVNISDWTSKPSPKSSTKEIKKKTLATTCRSTRLSKKSKDPEMAETSQQNSTSATASAPPQRNGFEELKSALPPLQEDFLKLPKDEPIPPDTGIPPALYHPRETSIALASTENY